MNHKFTEMNDLRMYLRMKYGFAIYVLLSKKEYALFLFKEPYLKNAEAENYQKNFKNVSILLICIVNDKHKISAKNTLTQILKGHAV